MLPPQSGVGRDAHAVIPEARDAGTYPETEDLDGGFTILDPPSREAALEWAARIAVACRCAQEVRGFIDPRS